MIPNPAHATQIQVINVVSSPVFTLSIISRIGFDETGSFFPGVFSRVSPGLFGTTGGSFFDTHSAFGSVSTLYSNRPLISDGTSIRNGADLKF